MEELKSAIISGEDYSPSTDGVKLYLNGGSDLTVGLERVADAGGTVLMGKTEISPDIGYFAIPFTFDELKRL